MTTPTSPPPLPKRGSEAPSLLGSLSPQTPGPTLTGELSNTTLPTLLFDLYTDAISGALLLESDGVKKIIYLRSGYPVTIQSNTASECLGKILLWDRKISRDQWRRSLITMRDTGKRQGSVLVDMGVLTPAQVDQGLELQFRFRLGEAFSWTEGSFQLWPGIRPPPKMPLMDIAPATLIQEGVKSFVPHERVLEELKPFSDLYLHPSHNPLWRFQALVIPPKSRALLDHIDGTARLSDLTRISPLSLHETSALVYSLLCVKMITPDEHRQRNWGTLRPPKVVRRPDLKNPARTAHGDLARLVDRLRHARAHEVLGVPPSPPLATVRLAYQRRAAERHPDRLGASRSDGLRELALDALQITSEAFALLAPEDHELDLALEIRHAQPSEGMPSESVTIRKTVSAPAEDAAATLADPDDEFEPTETDVRPAPSENAPSPEASIDEQVEPVFQDQEDLEPTTATESPITRVPPSASLRRASLDQELDALIDLGRSDEDLVEAEPVGPTQATHEVKLEDIIGELSATSIREPEGEEEARPPSIGTPWLPPPPAPVTDGPDPEFEEETATDQDPPSDVPEFDDETYIDTSAGADDDRLWKIIEAEQYHRQGLKLLDKARFSEAATVIGHAVELCDEEVEFRISLAWALFQAGLDDESAQEALGHLEDAIQNAPSARAYLFRGHILRFLDRETEAVRAYDEALRQDPTNEEATSELERITEDSKSH